MAESRAQRFFQQLICIWNRHKLKICHRDLEPENLLLDDDLNVKIADFGLSNEVGDSEFLKISCGNSNYAAPEVIRGRILHWTGDRRLELWGYLICMSCSVGACPSKMVMSRPCSPKSVVRLLLLSQCRNLRLKSCPLTAESSYHIPSSLSPDIRSLINHMLAVDPVKRIATPEITQHSFYTTKLPRYLTPLPPPLGPVLGTLSLRGYLGVFAERR